MSANDYTREAREVQQQRDYTPKAHALLNRVYELQGEVRDEHQQHELAVLEFSLGLHCRHQEDLSDAGVLNFEMRIARALGKLS